MSRSILDCANSFLRRFISSADSLLTGDFDNLADKLSQLCNVLMFIPNSLATHAAERFASLTSAIACV